MEQEKKQAVALMRYSAIAPLITGTQEDYESLSAYFRTVSAKGIKAPDGSLRHYSPGTLEKWYFSYKKSGFDALVPTGRSDCGVSRKIDEDLKEQIIHGKLWPLPADKYFHILRRQHIFFYQHLPLFLPMLCSPFKFCISIVPEKGKFFCDIIT